MWKNVALLGSFVVVVGGCGPDLEAACLDACEKGNECVETPQDCTESCAEAVKGAEKTGCEGETASFYDCVSSDAKCGDDIGFDSGVCEAEFGEVLSCLLSYCIDNPTDQTCSGTSGG